MPFGIDTKQYSMIIFSGFGLVYLGSVCAHLVFRPDKSSPNMAPYIEAQREILSRVQNRSRSRSAEGSSIVQSDNKDDNEEPIIKTPYGEFRRDELDPETGVPKAQLEANKEHNKVSRFWMHVPMAQAAATKSRNPQ